jgi:hypothetical protein
MKIAAVNMIKNECDILELFIKVNSRIIDAFYIIDHGSTDNCKKIIEKMQALGYPISYTYFPDKFFNQSSIISSASRKIASLNLYNHIIPLDADEFICNNNPQELKGFIENFMLNKGACLIPWKTYCPIELDYFASEAPLFHNFRARKVEPNQFFKIIMTSDFAKNCIVASGSHKATNPDYKNETNEIIPIELIHVPIRSAEQLIRKCILGSHALSMKKDRLKGEGFHWDLLANSIREKNYKISTENLLNYALEYATLDYHGKNEVLFDSPRIGFTDDHIEFKELAIINIIESFDAEIARLTKIINDE